MSWIRATGTTVPLGISRLSAQAAPATRVAARAARNILAARRARFAFVIFILFITRVLSHFPAFARHRYLPGRMKRRSGARPERARDREQGREDQMNRSDDPYHP